MNPVKDMISMMIPGWFIFGSAKGSYIVDIIACTPEIIPDLPDMLSYIMEIADNLIEISYCMMEYYTYTLDFALYNKEMIRGWME